MEKITNIPEYFEGIRAKKIKFKCDPSLTGNEKINLRMFWNDNSHADFDFHIHDGDDYELLYPFSVKARMKLASRREMLTLISSVIMTGTE